VDTANANLVAVCKHSGRAENKISSLRSMKRWFAFRSLTHCALNNHERTRDPFTVSIYEPCGTHARMPDAHALAAR
jgi:hypothetical protein